MQSENGSDFRCPRREYRGNQKRIFYCGSCRAFTKQKNATPRLRKGLFGGRKIECKISYIPVQLCEFPNKTLVLVAVYGFGAQPMLLLTNLDLSEKKKLCMIATKVYLMRWRIEEYFKFKKQQFELEDLRVMSLQSIRNLNLFATLVTGYIGIMSCEKDDTIFMLELKECSKRIFDVPKFIFYGLGYAIERVLARTHSGIKGFLLKKEQSQQLTLAEYFAGLGFK